MKMVKQFMVALVVLTSGQVFAGGTEIGSGTLEIKCRVDISKFELNLAYVDVLVSEKNGKISAIVNGALSNQDIKVESYKISPAALTTDFEDDVEKDKLNYGELRVATMNWYMKSELASAISFHIPLEKVASVKLYDLDGDSKENGFGGVVLVEAFDQNGDMLGRFLSSMLPGQCNDL